MVNTLAGIELPFPGVLKPVIPEVAVTVQLKVVTLKFEVKGIAAVELFEQMVWVKLVFVIIGVSFNANVKVACPEPRQFPLTVTVIK